MSEKNDKQKVKDVKLPLINSNRKNNTTKPIKTTTNKNKDTSSLSILSQNSLKANSVKSLNFNNKKNSQNKEDIKTSTFNSDMKKNILRQNTNKSKKDKNKESVKNDKSSDKINEIINDVNRIRNIKTKVIKNNINNMNNFNSNASSSPLELNNSIQNKLNTNKSRKYKFRIYKPLNPLLAPHEDMSFVKDHSSKENFYKNLSNSMHRMTKDKLKEIKDRRNSRIEKEKKKIEDSNRKIITDIKGQNSLIKSREMVLNDILNSINNIPKKISHKSAQKILEEGGMIEAYKYLIKNLCKN